MILGQFDFEEQKNRVTGVTLRGHDTWGLAVSNGVQLVCIETCQKKNQKTGGKKGAFPSDLLFISPVGTLSGADF